MEALLALELGVASKALARLQAVHDLHVLHRVSTRRRQGVRELILKAEVLAYQARVVDRIWEQGCRQMGVLCLQLYGSVHPIRLLAQQSNG